MEHKIPKSKFMPSSYQWQAFDRKKGINGMHVLCIKHFIWKTTNKKNKGFSSNDSSQWLENEETLVLVCCIGMFHSIYSHYKKARHLVVVAQAITNL